MNKPIVKIKLLPGGKMPEKKSAGAAAYDCYARESKYVDGVTLIGLGFAMELPEHEYFAYCNDCHFYGLPRKTETKAKRAWRYWKGRLQIL